MNRSRGLFGSARKRASRGPSGRFSDLFLFPVRVFAWIPESLATILILCLFLAASWLIVRWVMDEAEELPVFTVDPSALRCSARPDWLDMSSETAAEIMGEIKVSLSRLRSETIFDDTFLHLLRREVGRGCPWVDDVVSVQRSFPSQVKVRLRLRRPAGMFFWRDRGFFVDGDGVVISSFSAPAAAAPKEERDGLARGLPSIRGADLKAPPQAGRACTDGALAEGAAVAAEARRLVELVGDESVRILAVDVKGYGHGLPDDAFLITASGARILWGRSSRHAEFRGIDLSVEQKAENLRRVLKERPGLQGVAEVKLTFDKPSYTLAVEALTSD